MIKRFLVLTMHNTPQNTPDDTFGTFDSFDTREEADLCAAVLRDTLHLTVLAIVGPLDTPL